MAIFSASKKRHSRFFEVTGIALFPSGSRAARPAKNEISTVLIRSYAHAAILKPRRSDI